MSTLTLNVIADRPPQRRNDILDHSSLLHTVIIVSSLTQVAQLNSEISKDVVFAIDRSGSMSGARIDRSKMALIQLISTLFIAQDKVGIVSFDGAAEIVHPLSFLTNLDSVVTKINGIYSRGGTDIYRGLYTAFSQFNTVDIYRQRLIILLSDGCDSSFPQLLQEFFL
jgi:Mg-chelatase subunit ChlD